MFLITQGYLNTPSEVITQGYFPGVIPPPPVKTPAPAYGGEGAWPKESLRLLADTLPRGDPWEFNTYGYIDVPKVFVQGKILFVPVQQTHVTKGKILYNTCTVNGVCKFHQKKKTFKSFGRFELDGIGVSGKLIENPSTLVLRKVIELGIVTKGKSRKVNSPLGVEDEELLMLLAEADL